MEFLIYIPDTWRHAKSALRYWIRRRELPAAAYTRSKYIALHQRFTEAVARNAELRDKYEAQQLKLIAAQRELTEFKRGVGSGRGQKQSAKLLSKGSTPSHASNNSAA